MSIINTEHLILRDPLMNGFTYDEMQVGHTAYFTKTVTEHDVGTFAGVTGDFNPAHMNQTGAEEMELPGRIAHGALSGGLISAALGTKMPGQGCLYLSQTTKFVKMVRFGDTLTVRLEVIEKMEKYRVRIKTEVFNQNDELTATGEAVMVAKH